MITLSRGIRDREGSGEKEGVFFIDLNYSAISELCDQSTVGTKGYAFILDARGNIVYHPQQQQLYNELQTENISLIMDTEDDTVLTGTGSNGKLYSISRSDKTGWTVVDCTNVRELLSKSRQAQSIYVLTAVILVIVALLFSRFMARSITLPIQKLRDSMEKVQEGDFSVSDVVVDSDNEIGSLTKSFDVMTHRIQELMEQNVHEQEKKRKSELKALQSQINPHFLYNTLDSIIWMAETNDSNIVAMTEALAKLFRISLNKGNEEISLERELEHVKNYLIIQSMRYADKFTYEISAEPGVERCRTIKLILQPIVENCIYHGIKKKRGTGKITIRAYRREQNLIIEVSDDGCGMPEEICRKILSDEIESENISGSGIGVKNVNERIQLRFGKKYGLSYSSEEGVGTTVTYVLPYNEGGSI